MIYAIGDIHGQIEQLERALALVEADGGKDARIVFVGDYTDRGLNSRAVIDRLIASDATGRNWVMLRGNHDRMFTRFVRDAVIDDAAIASGKGWLHPLLGGPATLAAYGVEVPDSTVETRDADIVAALSEQARAAVPKAHLEFLESRPLMHVEDGMAFVHAGIRPGVALVEQDEEDLIWIRKGWLEDERDHGVLVVHGHTALDTPQHHGNRVNIDGGAGYGRPLVPVVFDGGQAFTLTEGGRIALNPV
jgi:serine/threonine protein phosphatase 1